MTPPNPSRRAVARRALRLLGRVARATAASCLQFRVTGLAAEAAFFALLSVPPLVFALTGSIGYVSEHLSAGEVGQVRDFVVELASRALTDTAVDRVVVPTIDDVLEGGRFDVVSVGFVLALWSGSRALHVFVDTITIMHGLGGRRGIIATRALSFGLYLLGLVIGAVMIPLVVAGPTFLTSVTPSRLEVLLGFYWPTVLVLGTCFLATLHHVAVPVRTRWRMNLPGAVLTLALWILGSGVLRWGLAATAAESRSIFGPLAAPIYVLLWLYLLAIAVLVGAALNAALDRLVPQSTTAAARRELALLLRPRRQPGAPVGD
ncbi:MULTISPECIES: YihY/virulence factor BrkB family protein [unclassified Nocardioides]|uniref:YihY/virulence factor BrkB family protein n=1 Tax=unclassified Nocardioides TaxID=2615069 RepID=UPI002406E1FD|nr:MULTISPECIES: YihY/virulence factor BrkB family protein [unclassified Nocardioides]